jgi:hypothetical protein
MFSPDIIRVIQFRRMRWVRHVALIGEMRNSHKIVIGNPERKRLLEIRSYR